MSSMKSMMSLHRGVRLVSSRTALQLCLMNECKVLNTAASKRSMSLFAARTAISKPRTAGAVSARPFSPVRWLCAQAPKPAGEAAGSEAGASAGEARVPMVVKVGRGAKTGVQLLLFLGIGALVVTSGWWISRELLPTGASPNAIFNRASETLRANPEVANKFGDDLKTYGEDHGGRREGRRFHIPDHTYEEDGVKYTRIRFMLEGNRGLKGVAYAEISDRDPEFNYLIVQVFPTREIITIVDKRKPEKPRSMRQSDVMMALQARRAVFYGNGPAHALSRQQEVELGESFQYVKYVRCDRNSVECDDAGVKTIPSWGIDGKIVPGFQRLEDLEAIVKKKK